MISSFTTVNQGPVTSSIGFSLIWRQFGKFTPNHSFKWLRTVCEKIPMTGPRLKMLADWFMILRRTHHSVLIVSGCMMIRARKNNSTERPVFKVVPRPRTSPIWPTNSCPRLLPRFPHQALPLSEAISEPQSANCPIRLAISTLSGNRRPLVPRHRKMRPSQGLWKSSCRKKCYTFSNDPPSFNSVDISYFFSRIYFPFSFHFHSSQTLLLFITEKSANLTQNAHNVRKFIRNWSCSAQDAQGGCQDFQGNSLFRRKVSRVPGHQMQLPGLLACNHRIIKLYRPQKNQLQSLPFGGHLNGAFAGLSKKIAAKKVSWTQQVRQSFPHDWRRRHYKVRYHAPGGLHEKGIKRRMALHKAVDLKLMKRKKARS